MCCKAHKDTYTISLFFFPDWTFLKTYFIEFVMLEMNKMEKIYTTETFLFTKEHSMRWEFLEKIEFVAVEKILSTQFF